MCPDGIHESLWIATVEPGTRSPLEEDLRVEVAIIGGGIVGLTAAYLLQKENVSVALLERGRILNGVTGNTTAKVTSQHGLIYQTLVERHGVEKARLHAEASERAKERIAALIGEVGAEARFTRSPSHVYTTDASRAEEFRKEAETARSLGLPASFTTETELPFEVGAAVRFENQAHFHPLRYLHRLAERAEAGGARIFEGTPVLALEDGAPCRLKTPGGTVEAGHVLVATNVPIEDKAHFVLRMKPKREYALAVRNEGRPLVGMYVNDDAPRRSVRPYESEEGQMLVVAGESHVVGERAPDDHYENLAKFARDTFTTGAVAYTWSTQDYYPVDDLALIGRFSPTAKRTFTATGFRAWGMTQGTVAAMMFTDWVKGRENPLFSLYDPFAPGRVVRDIANKEFLKLQAHVAKEFVAERLRPRPDDDLKPGEGHIVVRGVRHLAVSKDLDGTIRTVSATCSHMGCLLAWNPLERSWDCPCHGSRFGLDGRVLHGPAVKPLDRADE